MKKALFQILMVVFITVIIILMAVQVSAADPIASETISDGVYILKNKASGFYMDIERDKKTTGAHIQQYNYSSIPNSESTRSGLYRIEHIQNSDCYVLRTLRDSNNGVSVTTDGEIITRSITSITTSSSYSWVITYDGQGYYSLSPGSANNTEQVACVKDTTSSGLSGGINSFLEIDTLSNVGDRGKWQLIPYDGSDFSGCSLELIGSHVLNAGSTMNVAGHIDWSYFYSTQVGQNDPGTITNYTLLYPSGASGATAVASISSTGIISGVSGKMGMVAVKPVFSGGCVPHNYPLVYIAPSSGEYVFLMNSETSSEIYYLNGTAPYIRKNDFTYDATQIWEIIRTSNNTTDPVLIRCMGTNYYLTSPASTTENVNIQLVALKSSSPYDNRQLWYIEESSSAGIVLQSAYQRANDPSLHAILPTGENSFMKQGTSFSPLKMIHVGNEVAMLGIWEDGYDRSITFHSVADSLSKHYDSFGYHFNVSTSQSTAIDILTNSKIFISRSHGGPSVIQLNCKGSAFLRSTMVQNANLSNVDLVAFMGCSTMDGTNTITHAAVDAGATVAVGTTETVYSSYANDWIDVFFAYMAFGYSVEDAVDETNAIINDGVSSSSFGCRAGFVGNGDFQFN